MDLQSRRESGRRHTAARRRSRVAHATYTFASPAPRPAIGRAVTPLPAAHYFRDEVVRTWTKIGERHRLRDEQFLRTLSRWFQPGSVLEIGAATGHLSAILLRQGHDVLASDYSPGLVNAIKARGVPAAIVNAAAHIRRQTGRTFANVLAQNVLPLVWRDKTTVTSTLAAVHEVLEPQGRLICISAHERGAKGLESYFTPREQIAIGLGTGLFRLVTRFPHQVVPTGWYRSWNARALNILDFHAAHVFAIRLVWVMEKK
jgi:SAM-dependent methyltransferase